MRSIHILVLWSITLISCADVQPPYECAAQNTSPYQIRYYKQKSTCGEDPKFVTNSLQGGSAAIESYKLFSSKIDGGGEGSNVEFVDPTIQLDLSATKFALRFDTLLSITNPEACDDDQDDGSRDLTRKPEQSSNPDFYLRLPRYGEKGGVCAALPDSGTATALVTFPAYTCKDTTILNKVSINATLSDFKIISSALILSNIAKANVQFVEIISGGGTCTSDYKVVFLTPQVPCLTDYDCSPDPLPGVQKCGKSPKTSDHCLSLIGGASTIKGSGLTPNLFGKLPDGGFDLSGTCDSNQHVCIWDADAGI